MKNYLSVGVVLFFIIIIFIFMSKTKKEGKLSSKQGQVVQNEQNTKQNASNEVTAPAMSIDKNKSYTVVLKTTEGDIDLSLNSKMTPITVNNFVYLSKKGFYNNTIFHRVINGFMIQGGDPKGDGTGGPGYRFNDEVFQGEYTRGIVAMANAGQNTNGSQFFIMHQDNPLPKNYVIFGKVTAGMNVVDKIAEAPVTMSESGEESKPVEPVKVLSIEIKEE